MANYTTRVYDILNTYNDNVTAGYDINKVIEEHWQDIFDLDIWTTYDTTYKKTLCEKILRHYLFYEIGFETVARWKLAMNTKMAEIIPVYNVMYKNIEKAYENFFKDVDYSETFTKTENEDSEGNSTATGSSKDETNRTSIASNESTTTNETATTDESGTTSDGTSKATATATGGGTSSNNSDAWQASNDTPQGGLNGLTDNQYLSSAVHNYGQGSANSSTNSENDSESTTQSTSKTTSTNKGTANASGSSTSNGTDTTKATSSNESTSTGTSSRELSENYVKSIVGKMGSENNAELFNKITKDLINIDNMIINELKENFLLLWE